MLKFQRNTVLGLIAASLLLVSSMASASDWVDDWKKTMSDLWTQNRRHGSKRLESRRADKAVEIGIAYGTEKEKWLKWAAEEFAKTPEGKKVKINLIPMGSVEGGEAVLKQDKRINVWSPASSLVQDLLVDKWKKEHEDKDPIFSDAPLALTPMVIVMWQDRYDAFIAKYKDMNFKNIAEALGEKTGWAAIAQKPEWGMFTFAHTIPTTSNSGLLTLALMAYDYLDVSRDIKSAQVMDEGFLTWMAAAQSNISSEESSTGKLMENMLRYGPAQLNGVVVYENLALSDIEAAEKRWGKIKIIYPTRSVWNDNPYYILDVPWSTEAQRNAAKLFQDFLLSKPAQIVARDEYLFRPANVDVPILDDKSKFSDLIKNGVVKVDVATISRPKAEVLEQLLVIWKRNEKH
ncbi:MAG: substrate-binding domain-containing protein [Thiotrichaceae bacterium]